jgi:conjugal transfer pilus assembly protein TraV
MNVSRQHAGLVGLSLIGLILTACGHYKSDFGCQGYPEGSFCRPTTEIYARRHEQLTKMKNGDNGNGDHAPAAGSSASDRVAAVAGQTEMQLGQPNIKPPQVMGVWIAPWRDGRNFLHEASLVYAIVEPADWTYGRKPKGMDKAGPNGSVFAPFMSRKMVEAQASSGKNGGPNGGQPMMAPVPTAQPVQATPPIPSPSQDPAAILRQLQSQLPQQMPSAAAPIPSPYGGPPPGMDPELLQEQMQERMQNQRDKLFQ